MTTVIHVCNRKAKSRAEFEKTYVYCGRHPDAIGLGNKYAHGDSLVPGVIKVASREEAMRLHREETLADPEFCEWIRTALKDKVLGCWCVPKPCHCDTYAAIANGLLVEPKKKHVAGRTRRR